MLIFFFFAEIPGKIKTFIDFFHWELQDSDENDFDNVIYLQ